MLQPISIDESSPGQWTAYARPTDAGWDKVGIGIIGGETPQAASFGGSDESVFSLLTG